MIDDSTNQPTRWELNWAMTAHLSALCLYLGLLFINLLLPYLIWRWKREHSAYVGTHALAALNFQITITLLGLASTLAAFFIPILWVAVIGIFTANIVLVGRSADRAKEGQMARYTPAVSWVGKGARKPFAFPPRVDNRKKNH